MPARPSFVANGSIIKITVPADWSHTVVAASQEKSHHVVSLANSIFPGGREIMWSRWDKIGPGNNMVTFRGGSDSYATTAQAMESIVDLDFYYSSTKVEKSNIPSIVNDRNRSWGLQTVVFNKPANAPKETPDYMTLVVFVEDSVPAQQTGKLYDNMLLTMHLTFYPPIDLSNEVNNNPNPPPPPPGTRPGYNPALDIKRPATIENYLKYYDTVFLIDDSASMAEGNPRKWDELVKALIAIADKAVDEDTDGIDMYFLNSNNVFKMKDEVQNIMDKPKVAAALAKVGPNGGTPTGTRVGERLQEQLRKIDGVVGQPDYREIKPLDLIVITDGKPTDDPRTQQELEAAAKYITDHNYHPNHIGVQFVQIGNDQGADVALRALTQLRVNGMVDTVPYKGSFTPQDLTRVLLGGLHPNLRQP